MANELIWLVAGTATVVKSNNCIHTPYEKSNPHYYESRGIIKEHRNFYEGNKTHIQNK